MQISQSTRRRLRARRTRLFNRVLQQHVKKRVQPSLQGARLNTEHVGNVSVDPWFVFVGVRSRLISPKVQLPSQNTEKGKPQRTPLRGITAAGRSQETKDHCRKDPA